jgi:hypothetical protein
MFVFQFKGLKVNHHDKLSFRIAQNVVKSRANALTEESMQTYFDLIDKKIRELKLEDKPRIYSIVMKHFIRRSRLKKSAFLKRKSFTEINNRE